MELEDVPDTSSEGCFVCGEHRSNSLEDHHIVPRRYGGSDEPENIVTLCASCHSAIEKLYDERFYETLQQRFEKEGAISWQERKSPTMLGAEESLDREIPRSSLHVIFESELDGVEWRKAIRKKYQLGYEKEKGQGVGTGMYIFDEVVEDEELTEERREELQESHEWVKETRTVTGPREDSSSEDMPFVPQIEKEEETVWHKNKREAAIEKLARIHCGYCNAVFEKYEHAAAARHLRLSHGIDNPYAKPESKRKFPEYLM